MVRRADGFAKPHYHRMKNGLFAECYHRCRAIFIDWRFWLGLTIGFPFEHWLWEKVWPFTLVTRWLGL